MKNGTDLLAPRARTTGLVVRELDDELLIYDLRTDRAHCLNHTARLVWKHCTGEVTVAQMTLLLERELAAPVAEDVVWQALFQLGNDDLLEEQVSRPVSAAGVSRRDMLLRVGAGAAVALPMIASITAPTAAYAASCGVTCTNNTNCSTFAHCTKCTNSNGQCNSNNQGGCTCKP